MKTKDVVIVGIVVFIVLAAVRLANISYPLSVVVSNSTSELAVVGEGKVDVSPDTAYIDVGITVNNKKTVEDAQNNIKETNNTIIASLKKLGIQEKAIKTTNYSVYPNYTYENNKSSIGGYDGTATLTVKTKDIELVSKIIEAATQAGANQINNTRFVVDEPQKYREEAREKAIKNAQDQATKLAKSLNIKIGKITNIVESMGSSPLPLGGSFAREFGGGGGGGPSIESGSETVTSTVTLYFEKR